MSATRLCKSLIHFCILKRTVAVLYGYTYYETPVYISQLIRFARAHSHVTDFNNRNKFLTAKLLKQGYRYHKRCKEFSKFYPRHFELIEKYHVSLKILCNKLFVIQNLMEIWYINLRKSLEIQTSLIFSNVL